MSGFDILGKIGLAQVGLPTLWENVQENRHPSPFVEDNRP